MNVTRRFLILFTVLLSLTGCGNDEKNDKKKEEPIVDTDIDSDDNIELEKELKPFIEGTEFITTEEFANMKTLPYSRELIDGESAVYNTPNALSYISATVQRENNAYLLYIYDKIEINENGDFIGEPEQFVTQDNTSAYDAYLGNGTLSGSYLSDITEYTSKSTEEDVLLNLFIFEANDKLYRFDLRGYNIIYAPKDKYKVIDGQVYATIEIYDSELGGIDEEYSYDLIVKDLTIRKKMLKDK